MTDTRVSQVSALIQGMQSLSSAMEASKGTEAVFGAVLSQTAGSGQESLYSWTQQIGKTTTAAQSNQAVYEKEAAQTGFKDSTIVKKSDADITDKLPEDAKDQLEAAVTEVKDVLEEKLNVSEEELVQAMEELGISILDLMDPAQLTQLVMELTGSQDASELLLNPDFQTLLSQVEGIFSQLAEGLNLTSEELQQLSEQLSSLEQSPVEEEVFSQTAPADTEAQPETDVQQNAGQLKEEAADHAVPAEAEETEGSSILKTEQAAEDGTEQLKEPEKQNQIRQPEKITEGSQPESQTGSQTEEEFTGKQETSTAEAKNGLPGTEKDSRQTQISFQTTTQTIQNGVVETVQTVTQSQIDVESILRQISQMTKISVTQVQSSIEMQLNPEHLGKVYLQVVSKEGAITAQLAAQNEAVKEILESQVAVLKENMNQQGMKVEAIEVTIASHEFERNLEENQQDAPKESQETAKSGKRGINLNHPDELEGLMSEEEALAAQIMRDNGNSVDLTA